MAGRNFRELQKARWSEGKMLCVGLDSDLEKIPEAARQGSVRETIVAFNRAIIDATKEYVCAYKPNAAFYEAHGDEGLKALRETIRYIHDEAPGIPVLLDAKRGDIGNTNAGYADYAFGYMDADAVTVQPYLGGEALAAFFARAEKGIFVLCRTSNPGAKELQDLVAEGKPLYQIVARHAAREWNANGTCGLVVGATYPEELRRVRAIAPELPILVPGIGAQGGDLEASVKAGLDADGAGLIINASRAVIFASAGKDFAQAAAREASELDGAIRKAALQ